jgi:hypothetical protein
LTLDGMTLPKLQRKVSWPRVAKSLDSTSFVAPQGSTHLSNPASPDRKGCWSGKEMVRGTPSAYFGIAVPDFPNYFGTFWRLLSSAFYSPKIKLNCCSLYWTRFPISNGSLVQGIQMMGIYIFKCIDKLQTECIRTLDISHAATRDYNEHIQKFLKRTVWVGNCRSWYKRGTTDGPVVAIYGGTSFHFIEALKILAGRTTILSLFGECLRTGLPIWAMDLLWGKLRLKRFPILRLSISTIIGNWWFCQSYMISPGSHVYTRPSFSSGRTR